MSVSKMNIFKRSNKINKIFPIVSSFKFKAFNIVSSIKFKKGFKTKFKIKYSD